MSVENVREYFKKWGLAEKVQEFPVSSATVADAAKAVGCEEKRIAKTMSFLVDNGAVLIVMAGDAKVDNVKFKNQFHTKAVMIKPDRLMELVGHPMGGVCPFDVKAGVKTYLDSSLKRFNTVFPACGSANSAIELSMDELEKSSASLGWIDISKGWQDEG